MTQAANKKISPMLHSWKWNVRANKKMMIILTVLHMLASPAVFFAVIAEILAGNGIEDPDIYIVIGTITTLAAGFMGIVIGVNSFNCLHKKSVVDMKLSLPMNSDQRFVSDFLSGLFVYLAPFLAAQVIALLLAGFGLIFLEGKTLYERSYTGLLYEYTCDFFSDATLTLLKLILCGILTMLMLYTLTVLITVCCGSKFESVAYSIGVNIIIPLTIVMVTFSMFDGLFGIDEEYTAVRVLMPTSPFGGIVMAVGWIDGDYIYDYMHPAVWAVLFFLLTAAMGVLAFFLYRRRRAEQVSKPFVFKLAYYIVITGVTFSVFSAFIMGDSFIPGIITTAVIYLIVEAVTNRGFRRFWLSGIKYAATALAVFLIVAAAEVTDGFGAMWYVPASLAVRSAEISYHGILNDFSTDVTLKDRENIKIVTAAHKAILDEYKAYNTSAYPFVGYYTDNALYKYTLTIKYRLASGRTVEREYYKVITPNVAEILSDIDYTDEYKKQVAEYYTEEIHTMEEKYSDRYKHPENYDTFYNYNVRLFRVARSSGEYSDSSSELPVTWLYAQKFFDRLAEAYSADIMAIDRSNYALTNDVFNHYTVYRLDDGSRHIWIPKSFVNTLRVLEEYGFEIP